MIRKKLEFKYLRSFPSDWETYKKFFGSNGILKGEYDLIYILLDLKNVPSPLVYRKVLDLSKGAEFGKDLEQDLLLHKWLEKDPDDIIPVCGEYSDQDLESIFRFMMDGPHPEHFKDKFESLYQIIQSRDDRMGKLFSHAYNQLLEEARDQEQLH